MKTAFGYLLAVVVASFCVASGSIAVLCLIASSGTVSNPGLMFIRSVIAGIFTWLGLRVLRFVTHAFKLERIARYY